MTSIAHSQSQSSQSSQHMESAADTFKRYVNHILNVDRRFTGMSKYVVKIQFFWSEQIPTACAGDGFVFFNPKFWDKLNEEKKKTVLVHEIWHLILDHYNRGKGYDHTSYNIAADHVINLTVKDSGFVMGPKELFGDIYPCCDDRFAGMSTEQVYAIVHKERKNQTNSHKNAQSSPTTDQIKDLIKEALDGSGMDVEQQKATDEKIRQNVIQQTMQAGTNSGQESRILQTENLSVHIKNATYEEIFSKYLIDPLSGGKRTYIYPSRRQMKGQPRLKGKFKKRGHINRLTHLVYALDVSGSITQHMANQFLRSAATLKDKLNPKLMTIILWDTSIKFEKTFQEDELIDNIRLSAGGGTLLTPVYRRVEVLNPEALVIFTDLLVSIPPKPKWETIWFVPDMNVSPSILANVTYGEIYKIPEN